MKCRELEAILQSSAELVEKCGGRPAGSDVLVQILREAPEKTVAQLSKALGSVAAPPQRADREPVKHACDFANAVAAALKDIAKASVISDLSALSAALMPYARCEVSAVLSAVDAAMSGKKASSPPPQANEAIVRKHHAALEEALGDDDGFAFALKRLQDDPSVSIAEYIAIAKRFAFASTKSRSAAIKKIQARHQSLMISRAKAAATAGRIAG